MDIMKPLEFHFKDDGIIPNNTIPLLLYKQAFTLKGKEAGDLIEKHFASNNWTNSWRWGIYPFHHYHSNTHEVLGVISGQAVLHLGGEQGIKKQVESGDVIVIPAGVGHKCLSYSSDFVVLGAYPNGIKPDLIREAKSARPEADSNIEHVSLPDKDPLMGKNGGLTNIWHQVNEPFHENKA